MKRAWLLFSFVLAASLCLAGTGFAQTQTGTVEGKIVDQQGGVLPGVSVDLIGPQRTRSTVTDAEGVFRFVGIPPGLYSVKTELSGFLPQLREGVQVSLAKVTELEFTLKVGGLSETVEVSASALAVDVKSSATDTSLSNEL
ncbi:MAG: carboxypeptidase-like regulatory domain-containing protein, partial [Rhodospirillaceae bacterium]